MVTTQNCYDPTNKAPSPRLPNASMYKGGGIIAEFYGSYVQLFCMLYLSCTADECFQAETYCLFTVIGYVAILF